ncbi:zinc finger BED domain-containing protein 5-like [Palaemon carinicauda]|uniref:zinc finger BED domain-containing protein 5-like n=1 Tax=Palaemon carinicauda TaxID=392227 RepID=UPI0035B606B6
MNPETKHLHCMLHRYALASKTLPPDLKLVLDDVVHMVNAIKSSALNTRLFSLLCQEFGSDEEVLLLHTEAKSLEFTKKLSDSQWLQKLAYLSDIFLRLNSFNLSLQGRFATVSDFMDKLRSLTMKLELREGKVKDGNLSMFEHLGEALDKSQNTGKQDVMQLVQSHLASLRMELQSYFPELSELESKLIRNPFIVNVHLLPDNMQEEFLELVNDSVAKDAFETLSLTKFWAKMSEIYPVVSKVVLNSLLMFPSTYLSEQGFSTLLNMKTKHRSRLNVEHDLRLCLSNTAPRIEKLVYLLLRMDPMSAIPAKLSFITPPVYIRHKLPSARMPSDSGGCSKKRLRTSGIEYRWYWRVWTSSRGGCLGSTQAVRKLRIQHKTVSLENNNKCSRFYSTAEQKPYLSIHDWDVAIFITTLATAGW